VAVSEVCNYLKDDIYVEDINPPAGGLNDFRTRTSGIFLSTYETTI